MNRSPNRRVQGLRVWTLCAAGVIALMAMMVGGCVKSASNGWAQTSPTLRPEVHTVPPIHLGVRGE